MIRTFASRTFLLFLVTGGTAAVVNFASRILYNRWMDFSPAVILAYCTGMVTAFVLNRLFVFQQTTQPLHRSAVFFFAINGIAVLQTWAISVALSKWGLPALGVQSFASEIAHAIGILVPVFTSYVGHKRLSFK